MVAIFLTFYPLEFWPLKVWQMHEQPFGLFGWQGIIPCKSAKMAAICCDLMMGKLIDVQEVFSRIEPALFVQALDVGLLDVTDEIVQVSPPSSASPPRVRVASARSPSLVLTLVTARRWRTGTRPRRGPR